MNKVLENILNLKKNNFLDIFNYVVDYINYVLVFGE